MSSARRFEPRQTAVGDEARDQLLDAGIFDRAVARARDDDKSSVRKDTAPAAEVRRRIERVGASRQQKHGHTHRIANVGLDASLRYGTASTPE